MGKGSLGQTLGQGRKTDPGTRFRNPGTDGTASEFSAKGAGNPWQSRQSPEGTMRARPVFHEISRAAGPSQQSRKTNPGTRSRKPGTDGTASEFPAKGAGNPWQSRQSPEGT